MRSKRTGLNVLVYLFVSIHGYAQNNLWGKVFDTDHQPIPFVSIGYFNKRVGVVSDSLGFFSIELREQDSIKISAIGYTSRVIAVSRNQSFIEVILEKKITTLDTFTVSTRVRKTKTLLLGHYHSKNNYADQSIPDIQMAVFIPNKNRITGIIDELKFKLSEFRGKHYALRIRILSPDELTGMPGDDLLLDNNIIPSGVLKHINNVYLGKHNIRLPEKGVFVSFEWMAPPMVAVSEKAPFLLGNLYAKKSYMYFNFKEIKWVNLNEKSTISDGYAVLNVQLKVTY